MDAQLLTRARQVVAAGPFDARPAEVAAVHDTIWPDKAPVCPTLTCRAVLGRAFFAIKRWVAQQGAADDAPYSSPSMKKSTARFKSDNTIYTPHGLGVAYSNTNLTDKAARDILAADPDAKELFDVLPPAAAEDESSDGSTAGQAGTGTATQPASESTPVTTELPAGFDYKKLASALADEFERRQSTHEAVPATVESTTPTLTASTGGLGVDAGKAADTDGDSDDQDAGKDKTDGSAGDAHDGDKPVRLSRMNKDQLLAAYRTEVQAEGGLLLVDASNDDLRAAIAEKRAAQPNA